MANSISVSLADRPNKKVSLVQVRLAKNSGMGREATMKVSIEGVSNYIGEGWKATTDVYLWSQGWQQIARYSDRVDPDTDDPGPVRDGHVLTTAQRAAATILGYESWLND